MFWRGVAGRAPCVFTRALPYFERHRATVCIQRVAGAGCPHAGYRASQV